MKLDLLNGPFLEVFTISEGMETMAIFLLFTVSFLKRSHLITRGWLALLHSLLSGCLSTCHVPIYYPGLYLLSLKA